MNEDNEIKKFNYDDEFFNTLDKIYNQTRKVGNNFLVEIYDSFKKFLKPNPHYENDSGYKYIFYLEDVRKILNNGFELYETNNEATNLMISDYIEKEWKNNEINILEPSCGTGRILKKIIEKSNKLKIKNIDAVELYEPLLNTVRNAFNGVNFYCVSFLKFECKNKYDVVFMNPPFCKFAYVEHINHAYSLLKSDGIIYSIITKEGIKKIIKLKYEIIGETNTFNTMEGGKSKPKKKINCYIIKIIKK